MKKEITEMLSSNGTTKLKVTEFMPDNGKPERVFHLMHGMQEYIDRYTDFAEYLCDHGYYVVGYDMLGHGSVALENDNLGYIADKEGYKLLIKDVYSLYNKNKERFPDLPYIICGHSMGSFILRNVLAAYPDMELDGVIIMGTGHPPKALAQLGLTMAKAIKAIHGPTYRSELLRHMAFDGYNKKFKPNRTPSDWLCRNEDIINKYVDDPMCNYNFTVSAYMDLFRLILNLRSDSCYERMNKDNNILVISGNDDPVGDQGKAVKELFETYSTKGFKNLTLKLYDDYRHEILNEYGNDIVYKDILDWMENIISSEEK